MASFQIAAKLGVPVSQLAAEPLYWRLAAAAMVEAEQRYEAEMRARSQQT